MTTAPAARRSRVQTVIDNDRALRDAISAVTLESGWDAVTFSGVAKRAGLTVGAVYGRAENVADLGADVWEAEAGPWLRGAAESLIAAARAGSAQGIGRAFDAWLADSAKSALVTELLIASLFDHDLGDVVLPYARDVLGSYCTPTASLSRHDAAVGALLFSYAFGRALVSRGGTPAPTIDPARLSVLAGYFAAEPREWQVTEAPPLAWTRDLTGLEPQAAAIVRGTLDVVGRVGYKRATISRIARVANVPRGSVLSRFGAKVQLVADAAHRGLMGPSEVWRQYGPVLEELGPLMGRVDFLHEFLAPENASQWAINLELARLAQFEPALAEFRASSDVLEHTHLGVMLVASIVPGLRDLPYAGPFRSGIAT